jgi:hypothetical protein
MAVNPIASAVAPYVQKVTAGSQSTAQAAAMQEASETAAVTQNEAARGDMQAVRKLARQQQQAQAMESAPKTGTRTAVDHLA